MKIVASAKQWHTPLYEIIPFLTNCQPRPTMHDQANHLRRLVRHCAPGEDSASPRRPNLIVVASGKGGAGTTTMAVNLAVAMADLRLRTVLVDADLQGGDAALLCGVEQRYSLADVLTARRTIHEVLQPGPGAVRVVPGLWGLDKLPDCPADAGKRLLAELKHLAEDADLLILDGGKGPNRTIQQVYQAADLALILTTPENSSIINTYALIKMLAEENRAVPVHLLVNLAPTADVAEDIGRRMGEACRRFMGIQLTLAGHLPPDPLAAAAAAAGEPFVIGAPGCRAARHVARLAEALAASLPENNAVGPHFRTPDRDHRGKPRANAEHTEIQEIVTIQKKGKNDSTSRRPRPIASERCR